MRGIAMTDGTASRRRVGVSSGFVARAAAAIVAALWLSLAAVPAHAEATYDAQRAGNPVRIAAYIIHPVGVVLDYLIFRPAWWIGQHEPFKTLFGVTD
jgi:hypothetical protein